MEFKKKIISGKFFRKLAQTKAILFQNLWNCALLPTTLFWVHIALKKSKKFTQVLSHFVWMQLRRKVHKQVTKGNIGKKSQDVFLSENEFCSLSVWDLLCIISLGLLVSNFYETFVIVCTQFWLRSEPQIRPTRFAINCLFISARDERKVRFCVKLFDFFPRWTLIRLIWNLSRFVPNLVEIPTWNFNKELFLEIFSEIYRKKGNPLSNFEKFRHSFSNIILGLYYLETFRKNSHKYFHMLFSPS